MQVQHQDSQNCYFPQKTTTGASLLNYSLRLKSENTGESSTCCVDTAFEAPDVFHICTVLFVAPCISL